LTHGFPFDTRKGSGKKPSLTMHEREAHEGGYEGRHKMWEEMENSRDFDGRKRMYYVKTQ
jgi:hypothetical protein